MIIQRNSRATLGDILMLGVLTIMVAMPLVFVLGFFKNPLLVMIGLVLVLPVSIGVACFLGDRTGIIQPLMISIVDQKIIIKRIFRKQEITIAQIQEVTATKPLSSIYGWLLYSVKHTKGTFSVTRYRYDQAEEFIEELQSRISKKSTETFDPNDIRI